jgi:hypothetical protein
MKQGSHWSLISTLNFEISPMTFSPLTIVDTSNHLRKQRFLGWFYILRNWCTKRWVNGLGWCSWWVVELKSKHCFMVMQSLRTEDSSQSLWWYYPFWRASRVWVLAEITIETSFEKRLHNCGIYSWGGLWHYDRKNNTQWTHLYSWETSSSISTKLFTSKEQYCSLTYCQCQTLSPWKKHMWLFVFLEQVTSQ